MEHHSSGSHRPDPFLRDLTLLLAVARHSNFLAAATEMGISPALVTKRIAALEQRLGVKLFNRTTRQVSITSDGEIMVIRARKILADVDVMLEREDARHGPRGALRISTSQRLGRVHVAPALGALKKIYPGLDLWVELLDRRADLVGENFDIDIRMGDVHEQHLISHVLLENTRVLCASPGYLKKHGEPTSIRELRSRNCLVFREREQGFGIWRLEGPDGVETVKVSGQMASNNSDIVLDWACEGFGIMMAATWDVGPSIAAGKLIRILPGYAQQADIIAATTVRAAESLKVRTCLDFIRARFNTGPHALIR